MTPYIVEGLIIVSLGVLSLGVDRPKAAIEEGENILILLSLQTSMTFLKLSQLTEYANSGFLSPLADRMAAR